MGTALLFGLGAVAPAAAAADGTTVTLLSAGKGAKRKLRFAVKPGQKQQAKLVMEIEMAMAMGEMRMPPIKAPVSELTMNIEVTKVEAGRIRYRFDFGESKIIDDAGMPAASVEQMRDALSGMKGIKGFAVVDETGRTQEADFSLEGDADPRLGQMLQNLRSSLEQLTTPFPVEPVGVGARWKVETSVDQAGFPLLQVATYELTKLQGDRGSLAVQITQTSKGGDLQMPNLPKGTKATLLSVESGGSGSVDFDLEALGPVNSTSQVRAKIKTQIEAEGQKQVMEMDMNMVLRLRSGA